MKSYRVNATGKDREGKNKPYKVSITVEAWDEVEAKQKALAYLGNIYSACNWQADSAAITTGPARGARRPTIDRARPRRR